MKTLIARIFPPLARGSGVSAPKTYPQRAYLDAMHHGHALLDLKQPEAALSHFDRALQLEPDSGEAFYQRGLTLQYLGRDEEAVASFDSSLRLKADFAEAHYKRGNSLLSLKRPAEALASYDCALRLKPDHANAHYNRGLTLQRLQRPDEAAVSYERALSFKPDDAEALNNRANALLDLRRFEDALRCYDCALSIRPDYQDALYNRGLALRGLERPEEAARSYAKLVELAPDYPYAKGQLLGSKMLCCDWEQLGSLAVAVEQDILAGKRSGEPFSYMGIATSAGSLRLCAEAYARSSPAPQNRLWTGERYGNGRIRVGYLSGEFRDQATSVLITQLFELHDRNRFELFAFDNGWDDHSEIRARIESAFDEIIDVSRLPDLEAAAMIRERKIDILLDLNGYFGQARQGLLSYKPCPIQVNYLGFPGTLGADYIDYILADLQVIPRDHQRYYTEKVVYLPDTYQVNDAKRRIAGRVPSRAECRLPETGFVFCCFNNSFKITPRVFDVWMRLLNEVEGSVLWLLETSPAATRNLRRESERRGIAPERLVFAPKIRLDEHLSRHQLADLFLDTLPCNAHTTASDALWAGLPVLTCMGSTFPGRVAGSLLNAVGLPELITDSLESYEALALRLASVPELLAEIRSTLNRNRMTYPLFDTDRFRRHIESAYVEMWERHERGEPPQSFAVRPME
ncbi:MAG TPA: tetratricopeptide repeat protein [Burkholderiales bacterium]|nr:tetratricopeptide repeat protein [Burkholderiales bacterium]